MTNEAVLRLLDYLCNEARNAMHASSGLIEFQPDPGSWRAWHKCLSASRSSADRLLRAIDDMRALLGEGLPAGTAVEEFDLPLCVGEVSSLLNLASRDGSAKLAFEQGSDALRIRQDRPALEQALTRILQAALRLSGTGVIRILLSALREDRVRVEVLPPGDEVARRLASWLNLDPAQLTFVEDEISVLLSAVVAGRGLRALGAGVELGCRPGGAASLAIDLPARISGREQDHDHAPAAPRPLRLLVAEDSDESFALTELLLRSEIVDRARTGFEAIDKVKQRRFDAVFMDVHMPGMDGYECIRTIRNWETQSGNARTPIVVISSDDLGTQTRCAAQSGCSGYLRKPVRQSDLVSLLEPLRATHEVIV